MATEVDSAGVDFSVIQLLQQDDEQQSFLSVLVSWISGDEVFEDSSYSDKLKQTSPLSFAISFLNYVRSESDMSLAEDADLKCGKHELVGSVQDVSRAEFEETHEGNLTAKYCITTRKEFSYDAEFPALDVSNANVVQQSNHVPKRHKRRVTPTPLANPAVDSAFVLAKLDFSKENHNSSLEPRSLTSRKVDMDVLVQQCAGRKSRPIAAKQNSKQPLYAGEKLQIAPIDALASTRMHLKTPFKSWIIPNSTLSKLKRFAHVHSKLMTEKMVPSLIAELQFLLHLLTLKQCAKPCGERHCAEDNLFGCRDYCSVYACFAMEHLGRIVESVGEPLLSVLIQNPFINRHSPTFLMRMKESLARHQASLFQSFKPYKLFDVHSNCSKSAVMAMPVSLPFQPGRDSRNNFKTQEAQNLYNNRELCRDYFYAIIREAASFQNSFEHTVDEAHLKTQEYTKTLMTFLAVQNYSWFTDLFLEHLTQVAVCGETDPVVTGLARQDIMKLQKLHDRITIRNKNKPMTSSIPLALVSKPYKSNAAKTLIKASSDTWNNLTFEEKKEAESDITSLYPPPLRVYVWILEGADSYRLNMQMIWSLKSKICKLSEIQHSQDAAGIGSVLTQRVLSLKAMAGLLGFLSFSPLVGSSSHGYQWEMCSFNLPINVTETLQKAVITESVLLNLPWVLDYLQLIKVNKRMLSLPIFERALQAVQDVYNYALLDPNNENFGVPSMCILASLDRFLDFINFPAYYSSVKQTLAKPGKLHGCAADKGSKFDRNTCHGLDRMKGLVDSTYIQQCCPSLMELRLLLAQSNEGLSCPSSSSKPYGGAIGPLRKITPVHNPSSFHILDPGSSAGLCDVSTSAEDLTLIALQQSFFQQRQELQRLVDFVIDTTAANAARAASLKCVPPILKEALESLEVVLAQKHQVSSCEGWFQQELEVEAAAENIILSSLQKALCSAMEYAKGHAAEQASRAFKSLANQDESLLVVGIAAKIAADTASLAACKKTLANISSDIRKYVTQEIESWRQRCKMALKVEEKLQERAAVVGVNMGTDIQRLSDTIKKSTVGLEVLQAEPTKMKSWDWEREGEFLVNRIICCCAVVSNICANNVQLHNRRHTLRIKLATISTSLETLLSSKYKEIPGGGFDLYTQGNPESHYMSDSVTLYSAKFSSDVQFRIERALIRRCVTLTLYMCLGFPIESMGYDIELLAKCICDFGSTREPENEVELLEMWRSKLSMHEMKTRHEEVEEKSESGKEKISDCQIESYLGNFMTALLGMWRAIVECGICDVGFFISEFLSLRGWSQALHSQPWKDSKLWFQAVKHAVASVLNRILCMDDEGQRGDKSACKLVELLVLDMLQMNKKESTL